MSERRGSVRDGLDAALGDGGGGGETGGGGLSAWVSPTRASRVEVVALEEIGEPLWRPAEDPSDPAYRALKSSVRASGILQPVLLRPAPGGSGFQVVSGARRVRAARETAQPSVPALVRGLGDLEALLGGWDAVQRQGLTEAERADLASRCAAAGMPVTELEALLVVVPVRPGPAAPETPVEAEPMAAVEVVGTPEPVVEAAVEEAPTAEAAVEEAAEAQFGEAEVAEAAPCEAPAEAPGEEIPVEDTVAGEAAEALGLATVEVAAATVLEPPAPVVLEPPVDEPEGWPSVEGWGFGRVPDHPPPPLPISPRRFPVPRLEDTPTPAPATTTTETAAAVADLAEPVPIPVQLPTPQAPAHAVELPAVMAPEAPADTAEPPPVSPVEVVTPAPLVPQVPQIPAPPPIPTAEPAPFEPAASAAGPEMAPPAPPPPAEDGAPAATVAEPPPAPAEAPTEATTAPVPTVLTITVPPPPAPARAAPQEPVPAFPVGARPPRTPLHAAGSALTDRNTVATLGVAVAVGAVVFIIVAVLLGEGASRPLAIAVIVALAGFLSAILSLALPRRSP